MPSSKLALGDSNLKYNGDYSLPPPADPIPMMPPMQGRHLALAVAVTALTCVASYNLLSSDFEKRNIPDEHKYLVYTQSLGNTVMSLAPGLLGSLYWNMRNINHPAFDLPKKAVIFGIGWTTSLLAYEVFVRDPFSNVTLS